MNFDASIETKQNDPWFETIHGRAWRLAPDASQGGDNARALGCWLVEAPWAAAATPLFLLELERPADGAATDCRLRVYALAPAAAPLPPPLYDRQFHEPNREAAAKRIDTLVIALCRGHLLPGLAAQWDRMLAKWDLTAAD